MIIIINDIVMADFREKYDRESHPAIVREIKEDRAKVEQLGTDEQGYYATDNWMWRALSLLKKIGHINNPKKLYI